MVNKMCIFLKGTRKISKAIDRKKSISRLTYVKNIARNFCLGNFSRLPQFCLGNLDLPSKLPRVWTLMLYPAAGQNQNNFFFRLTHSFRATFFSITTVLLFIHTERSFQTRLTQPLPVIPVVVASKKKTGIDPPFVYTLGLGAQYAARVSAL